MATPGWRVDNYALNIAFDYEGTIAVGDQVEITAARKVQRITNTGRHKRIGTVLTIRDSLGECVCRVPYLENRQDRVAGETVVPGPFVWGASNKVYQYQPATAARHDGTTTGPTNITLATNDAVKLKVEYGSSQNVTLTAGVGRTFAQIAAQLNAALTGIVAEVDAAGNLNLVCTELGKSIEVEAVTHDAYTDLGWTVGVYAPTNATHSGVDIAGMVIVGGDADDAVETLEY